MPRSAPSQTLPGEIALIQAIRRKAAKAGHSGGLRMGIGDDCAVLRPRAGYEICVTTDFSLEGVHFRRDWHPPQSAGHRCLARGLSDLAAMGAEPLAVFLSLAVPADLPRRWLDGFLSGLLALAGEYRVPLAGGDTAQSSAPSLRHQGLVAADIVAIGQLPRGSARLRSEARAGDTLYVTGALGGAAAELLELRRHPAEYRSLQHAEPGHPHLYPRPRVATGRKLLRVAHAMIDISDGLSTDLTHLCQESNLGAVIDEAALPIHVLARRLSRSQADALQLALHGGEDYELLFTASPSTRIPARIAGVPVHRIGVMRRLAARAPFIVLNTSAGSKIPVRPAGWKHFRGAGTSSTALGIRTPKPGVL